MDIAIDFILAGLLLMTIFYSSLLNQKINALKSDRLEMEKLLSSLTGAIDKAEHGINQLQISTSQGEYTLSNQIKKAGTLKTDLEYFCEKADQILDKLDHKIEETKVIPSSPAAAKTFEPKIAVVEPRKPFKPILNANTLR